MCEMNNIRVSIVIPVYNVFNYLDACLLSIVHQSFNDFEVILVDDGSLDGSGRLCDDWASRDSRIRVIHQINQGLSAARNTGLVNARGEWVLFVDSDDWVHSDLISKCLSVANHDYSDVVSFRFTISSNNEINFHYPDFPSRCVVDDEGAIHFLLAGKIDSYSWSLFVKRKLYIENGILFPTGRVMEDVATTYMLLSNARSVSFIEDELYFYRMREGSILHSCTIHWAYDFIAAVDGYIPYLCGRYPEFSKDVYHLAAKQLFNCLSESAFFDGKYDKTQIRELRLELASRIRSYLRQCNVFQFSATDTLKSILINMHLINMYLYLSKIHK